jgi:hypothetical protein
MARVRSIAPGKQSVKLNPSEVDCDWQTVQDEHGNVYVHLATFGSDQRRSERKTSQQLQFDRSQAEQLIGVLATVFPGLVAQADSDLAVEEAATPTNVEYDGAHSPRDENLATALRNSEAFKAQWSLAGRVALDEASVVSLIGTLAAAAGTRLPLNAIPATLGIRPARLQGALATLEKVMNVEGYGVLQAADAHLRLDVPLLREQFRIP